MQEKVENVAFMNTTKLKYLITRSISYGSWIPIQMDLIYCNKWWACQNITSNIFIIAKTQSQCTWCQHILYMNETCMQWRIQVEAWKLNKKIKKIDDTKKCLENWAICCKKELNCFVALKTFFYVHILIVSTNGKLSKIIITLCIHLHNQI
jgi:hypothetical protein